MPVLLAGIGFAKTLQGNCQLIRDLPVVRQQLQGCLRHQPLLAGPSRKGFLGKLTGAHTLPYKCISGAGCVGTAGTICQIYVCAHCLDVRLMRECQCITTA